MLLCILTSVDPGFTHFDVYVAVSDLNLHFPDNRRYGTSSHMLICHLYILFSEVSIKFFGSFFSLVVCYC